MSTIEATDSAALRRDLRLIDAVTLGLGAIIGAGIFVVTDVAARVAGPAFIVGLLIAGVAATCNALSSAQLAAAYRHSGGTYEYGYQVLSPRLGFAAGWLFLVSKPRQALPTVSQAQMDLRYVEGGHVPRLR